MAAAFSASYQKITSESATPTPIKAEAGASFDLEKVNLAELERRTGITRKRLRKLKKDDFIVKPHGLSGVAKAVTVLTGFTGVIDALLTKGVTNSSTVKDRLDEAGYKGGLTRRLWTLFAVGAPFVGAIVLGGCMLGSYIILPFLYPDIFPMSRAYLFPAITSQIFYFVSGVMLVVLLRFRGEKKQFLFNLGYVLEFFALTIAATYLWGLDGFVWSSLVANALRLVAVIFWGYLPEKSKPQTEVAEVPPTAAE